MTFDNLKNSADQQKLNEHLQTRSYVDGGAEPTSADFETYKALTSANVNTSKLPHVARWAKHIESFSENERSKWASGAGTSGASQGKSSTSAPAKEGGEDFDLFGSESEDDEEKERVKQERLKAYAEKKSKKPGPIAKSSVILDVKPWDDETDMEEMQKQVKSIEQDGLVWGASKLIPMAYGIKKLQVVMTIEDDKVSVDDLIEKITEFEELVQSCDIVAFNKI
ncbi:Elongation factor 1-beta' [Aphelenchoides besseyi]|nr:Elongation factor 1-beta' [Aphelenchoides besseyi]KAI6201663.1 Elongation factor 1-beta' [Aphelenchoides besseyi]